MFLQRLKQEGTATSPLEFGWAAVQPKRASGSRGGSPHARPSPQEALAQTGRVLGPAGLRAETASQAGGNVWTLWLGRRPKGREVVSVEGPWGQEVIELQGGGLSVMLFRVLSKPLLCPPAPLACECWRLPLARPRCPGLLAHGVAPSLAQIFRVVFRTPVLQTSPNAPTALSWEGHCLP